MVDEVVGWLFVGIENVVEVCVYLFCFGKWWMFFCFGGFDGDGGEFLCGGVLCMGC